MEFTRYVLALEFLSVSTCKDVLYKSLCWNHRLKFGLSWHMGMMHWANCNLKYEAWAKGSLTRVCGRSYSLIVDEGQRECMRFTEQTWTRNWNFFIDSSLNQADSNPLTLLSWLLLTATMTITTKKNRGCTMCSSRKNPYPPHGRSLEIPWRAGVIKAKILESKYEAKLEFPGGGGCKTKTFCGGSLDIFWSYTM